LAVEPAQPHVRWVREALFLDTEYLGHGS
jgi:hypothetical protein